LGATKKAAAPNPATVVANSPKRRAKRMLRWGRVVPFIIISKPVCPYGNGVARNPKT
jgi:hypothetical protein